jgi:hypothetical protein
MTVRTVAFITASLAVLLMAGCGGKAAHGETASSTVTIEDLARTAGCAPFLKDDGQLELGVQESGDCTVAGGKTVRLYLFSSDANRDSWLTAASQFASGTTEHGPRWVVNGDDRAATETVAAALS